MKATSAPLWSKGFVSFGFVLRALTLLCICQVSTAQAATFTVSNANDSGAGSLRQAMINANETVGVDTITFNITGTGVKTINLLSDLPFIEEHLVIDGTTQPGFSGAPLIQLNGNSVDSSGIYFAVTNPDAPGSSAVKSLILNRFPFDGLAIFQTNHVTVTGCYIGTNATGTAPLGNSGNGIAITGSSNVVVGGPEVDSRNLISCNGGDGVLIESYPPFGPVSTNNSVQGNYIGTNINGVKGFGNAFDGVHIENSNNTTVGGLGTGQANLIASSGFSGVYMPLKDGVTSSTGNVIRGNRIFDNYMLGIDLADDAERSRDFGIVTLNDAGDADAGANNNQNYPVLTAVSTTNGVTTVSGTLNSRPNRTYALDFYRNSEVHINGYTRDMVAEGENYITTATVTTNATGNATFSVNLGAGFSSQYITTAATQTTAGAGFNDTSEFSAFRLVPASRSVQFSAATYTINEAAGTATIIVTRSGDSTGAATVNYATTNDTATVGSDYTATSGTLNFAAGQTTQTFTVPIAEDSTDEANETIALTLSNATGGSLGTPSTATLTIVDNDAAPSLSINDINVTETPNGTNAVFTVTLSAASGQIVTVNYATANGTSSPATAGSDYGATNGELIFAEGQTARTITVPVFDDTLTEGSETFVVNLSGAVNATIGDTQGVVTIADNEVPPTLSINDVTVNEGTATGTVNAVFSVTLSMAAAQTVTVNYATVNGTATQPADYTAQSGTLSFVPGQTSKTVTVVVKGDALDEIDEVFRVNLSNVSSNATIGAGQGIGTITDNDPTPTVSINDATVTEGNSATVNATFTVILSAPSGQTVAISAIPSNGSARSPGDYTAGGFRLTFAPGETSKIVSVPVKGDLLDEVNETFFVILSAPANVGIGRGRGVGTITDDDVPPKISLDDLSFKEYNAGQTTAAVRLRLSAPSGQIVRVSYATANGTARAGSDYSAVAPTVVAFNVGSTVAYARVLINGDVLHEPNETFLVNLSSPQNAAIVDGQAVGTILNDDTAPALSINDVSLAEGNAGTRLLTFTVTLSKASGQTITVNFATANGTAQAGTDYVAQNSTLTFAPGSALTQSISVVINGDTVVEGNEAFYVLLSGATNASISKARGVGTISNDDTSG